MSNTKLDKAIEAIPELDNLFSLFTKELHLAHYADGTIYSYRLKISQAALYLKKPPDDFTRKVSVKKVVHPTFRVIRQSCRA